MSKLANKQCPRFKSACLLTECAWYDEILDNCAIKISNFNMYKLTKALAALSSGGNQAQKTPNPYPAPPSYPGMR